MNKIIKILLITGILILVFVGGYELPFIHDKPIPPPTPIEDLKPLPSGSDSYIKDGILYTSVKTIPLACITKITLIDDAIPFVIIDYTISKYHCGMIAMSYQEYKRLFGDTNAETKS